MRNKKYRDIETGKTYLEITPFIFYSIPEKEIVIIRRATMDEENGIPINNDFPYGQPDMVDIELVKRRNIEDATTSMVVQERIKLEVFLKNLNSLKTDQWKK